MMKCFGWDYNSSRRTIAPAPAMPDFLVELRAIACNQSARDSGQFEQAIVTWYPAGYGIGAHCDADVFGDPVLGFSFAATATMTFYRGSESFNLALRPRSLLVMSGPSRSEWAHEIAGRSVRAPRWSVTFRSVLKPTKS